MGKVAARLDPQTLLSAYAQGVFPMADESGEIHWYHANPRGIIPLEDFHVPGTLRQLIRQQRFELRINFDFEQIMRACMATRVSNTWINDALIRAYCTLHHLGYAHSVECWREGQLAGGLYGVSLGAAFFGESMFHYERDASKVALVCLVHRLRERGFELLDTQANTPHLRRFGCIDIDPEHYLQLLEAAIDKRRQFA